MARIRGPIDDTVESLAGLMIRNRGRRRTALVPADKEEFDQAIKVIWKFTRDIGVFATDDLELIYSVFDDTLDGFRAHLGGLGWIRSAGWLLAMISGGLTYSGRLYVEIRGRIQTLTSQKMATTKSPAMPLWLEERFKEIAFNENFARATCTLHRHKKTPELNRLGVCPRGCDLLLLSRLGFHEIIIGRIVGLKRGTAVNRFSQCKDALNAAQLKRLSAVASHAQPQHHG